jgi:hypothetical protein
LRRRLMHIMHSVHARCAAPACAAACSAAFSAWQASASSVRAGTEQRSSVERALAHAKRIESMCAGSSARACVHAPAVRCRVHAALVHAHACVCSARLWAPAAPRAQPWRRRARRAPRQQRTRPAPARPPPPRRARPCGRAPPAHATQAQPPTRAQADATCGELERFSSAAMCACVSCARRIQRLRLRTLRAQLQQLLPKGAGERTANRRERQH